MRIWGDQAIVFDPKNIPGIDAAAGLQMVRGNVTLYARLLNIYLREHGGAVAAIRAAVQGGDLDAAHVIAHTLKGTAGTLGALRVSDQARALDEALRVGSTASVLAPLMDALEAAQDELLAGLRSGLPPEGLDHRG